MINTIDLHRRPALQKELDDMRRDISLAKKIQANLARKKERPAS